MGSNKANDSVWNMTARSGLLLVLLAGLATGQRVTTIRSVPSLPATCNPGSGPGGTAADHVDLWNGFVNTPYYCLTTNTWVAYPSFFDVPYANFSALVTNHRKEMPKGVNPPIVFGIANQPTTMWVFNDRDGSDPVQSTLGVIGFITNNVDRANGQQASAIAAQARVTGSGNFGLATAATFNTQYNGSAVLHQAVEIWAATPRIQGSGRIANTVGVYVANQAVTGAATARGIELENFGTGGGVYALYVSGGNNWLGPNNTWARRVTLGCPPTESVCKDDFASLDSQPNGTMKYCSDCTVTSRASCTNVTTAAACKCSSGGTGAIAKRINGAWLCN